MIKKNKRYQGYQSAGLDLAGAAALFRKKYGHSPVTVEQAGVIILCGPIGEEPGKSLTARAEAGSEPMGQSEALQLAMELGGATA